MADKQKFIEAINAGYTFNGKTIPLGKALLDGECLTDAIISIPLKTLNRHGLVAGATGTGKTKTLQKLAETLSENGVGVLMMDIKGDISGLAKMGVENDKIKERQAKLQMPFSPMAYPCEFMSLTGTGGVKLRATVSEFGPVLFSKILGLNDTQSSIVSILFKYSDDHQLPIVDLKDFKALLNYATGAGQAELEKDYGKISATTVSVIIRQIVQLEQQGANVFFGEPSFEVEDLVRKDENGFGYINVIRLTDIQDKPNLFSTFMLSLLSEIYHTFPEAGDLEQPKLVVFIDEAHLIFNEASKDLNDQLETIIKLIRSKGIGIFFCTQNPTDIPNAVLSQLGLKIQHALRAFTAKDRKDIKMVAENYPESSFYKTDEVITQLGIGEAFVTALNEKGIPTPLAVTLMSTPSSRMDVLTPAELQANISNSKLVAKYQADVDPQSAFEMLTQKMKDATSDRNAEEEGSSSAPAKSAAAQDQPSMLENILGNPLFKAAATTATRTLTRSLLGSLGLGAAPRRRRSSGWF